MRGLIDSKVLVEILMEKWKPDMTFNEMLTIIQSVPRVVETYEIDGLDSNDWEKILSNQNDNDWIPCSERMPEKEGEYLVQEGYESNLAMSETECIKKLFFSETYNAFMGAIQPVAWRKLPKKYEEKE